MKRGNACDEPRWKGEVSKPKSRCLQMLSRAASLGRRYLGPEAPKRNVPEAGVGWKGTWEDQNLLYSVNARLRVIP